MFKKKVLLVFSLENLTTSLQYGRLIKKHTRPMIAQDIDMDYLDLNRCDIIYLVCLHPGCVKILQNK